MAQSGQTEHLSRRDLLRGWTATALALLAGPATVAGCTSGTDGAARRSEPASSTRGTSTDPPDAESEEIDAEVLLARVLGAVAGAPTARTTSRRQAAGGTAGSEDGTAAWSTAGAVRYPASGPRPQARFALTTGGEPALDTLVLGDAMFTRDGGQWTEVLTDALAAAAQVLDHEVRRCPQVLGQAHGVPGVRFRRLTASGPGSTEWVASLSAEQWFATVPEGARERYSGATSVDVRLALDGDGRPAGRTDTVRPDTLGIRIETTWTGWGADVDIPFSATG